MWEYSDKVRDHFLNPRNVGEIKDATVIGEVGSLARGDALRLYLKLDGSEVIQDAKFQSFGGASAIASSSALTELIKGRHIDDAVRLTSDDISKYLDGLPEAKMHTSVMGMEALEVAYARYRGLELDEQDEEEGRLICRCFSVPEGKIERAVRDHTLNAVEEITHYTKAGGGCGSCHIDLEVILDRIRAERKQNAEVEAVKSAAANPAPAKPIAGGANLTQLERMKLVQEVLDRDVRPGLAMDGGDMELVDIQGTRVFVQLHGHCVSCSSSTATMRFFVEDKLRELVDPAIEVIDTTSHGAELHAPPLR
ncbi:MAG: Fe-S cluster assembly protein NifU [Planctomycetes bacterium]|nr:Fe-S cluster assembly protein NifU [Planctomycetota bacterium]